MTDGHAIREETLPDDERDALHALIPVGYGLIGIEPGSDAEDVGTALEATIARLSDAPPENPRQVAVALGAAYGDAVCRIADWEWVRLIREGRPVLAVASDDRSVCTHAIDAVLDRLAGGADGHLTGFLVALERGLVFDARPGEYRSLP